jgi:quercetin dioxygenase-like cupin family protein
MVSFGGIVKFPLYPACAQPVRNLLRKAAQGFPAGQRVFLNQRTKEQIMEGTFLPTTAVEREQLDWGTLGWISRPSSTGAAQLVVIEVNLLPGCGHNFHKHPDQEEVIYVLAGQVEQWLREEKRLLGPGDSVFIPADVVHASFNIGNEPAKVLAILGPCVSGGGYVSVEVGDQAPWNTLR